MTARDVLSRLRNEVGDRWTRTDWPHGVTLERCALNPPELRLFGDPVKRHETLEFWVVLEEDPEHRSGYCIVFDEQTGNYGLATTDVTTGPVFLGFYGDFVTTLEAM